VSVSSDQTETAETSRRVWLFALAAPREFQAALEAYGLSGTQPRQWECVQTSARADLVWTGVGKANAAGGVARVLDPIRHQGVISVGIAGAMPGSGCNLGDVICASSSVFVDEGIGVPDGFVSCAQMGFPPFDNKTDSITHDHRVIEWLGPHADHIGPIACVSLCSGTDEAAVRISSQHGVLAETMEGAATALAARRIDGALMTGELRVISNTTGDRNSQRWDLDGSLAITAEVLGRIAEGLS